MKIIVDVNALAPVFNEKSSKHDEFRPVRDAIVKGRTLMTYGGTKYKQELARSGARYLAMLANLERASKIFLGDDALIDQQTTTVQTLEKKSKFNDHHIIAIQIVTRAEIICSEDKKAYPYFKKRDLYPKGHKLAKIYTGKKNANLLG